MIEEKSRQVRRMFASIAHRYDFLNRLLSLTIDQRWRRFTRKTLAKYLPHDALILDLCTGTGDLAFETAQLGTTLGCDFCHPMLDRGVHKAKERRLPHAIWFVEGDALHLPVRDQLFDAVTIAFGLRNLESPRAGMVEMFRVLVEGGMLAILEFSMPTMPVFRDIYRFYFTRILPRVGALISGELGPYSYLPASVGDFAQPAELGFLLRQIGFESVASYPLTGGIATLTLVRKGKIRTQSVEHGM